MLLDYGWIGMIGHCGSFTSVDDLGDSLNRCKKMLLDYGIEVVL